MVIASGKHTKSYETWPFIVHLPLTMVIFRSYVSLPDGNIYIYTVYIYIHVCVVYNICIYMT